MRRNLLMHYDYDDILIGSNNLDQQLVWFKKHYKKLNKFQKESLKYLYLDNTYMSSVIEQMNNDIKEEKRKKIIEKNKVNEEENKERN